MQAVLQRAHPMVAVAVAANERRDACGSRGGLRAATGSQQQEPPFPQAVLPARTVRRSRATRRGLAQSALAAGVGAGVWGWVGGAVAGAVVLVVAAAVVANVREVEVVVPVLCELEVVVAVLCVVLDVEAVEADVEVVVVVL